MCESSAYLQDEDGQEELLLEDVVMLKPSGGRIVLMNILGEKKEIEASIDQIDLLRHKILLRKP
ncbi:MAG TPA: CooT family nickel-binding protein [Myxococcota bacterium]|nr:CooT family nickel-binding protein [Myxococcota bacterium]